jgi:hypothetical protein
MYLNIYAPLQRVFFEENEEKIQLKLYPESQCSVLGGETPSFPCECRSCPLSITQKWGRKGIFT